MDKSFIKPAISLLCGTLFFMSCGNNQSESIGSTIDIIGSINELKELKLSDIAKTIRYVPLETTDESLIGNNPMIKIFADKIIITADKECFLFDKETGKFHCKVGHIGQDPEAYSSVDCWGDNQTNLLHFLRNPNQLVKYDLDGNFQGKIELQGNKETPMYFKFTNSEIIGYNNDHIGTSTCSLSFFNKDGIITDSIKALLPASTLSIGDIEGISVFNDIQLYGNLARPALMIINYRNEHKSVGSLGAPVLWEQDNETRFKEFFVDTIYTVKEHKLEPYISFNMGEWQWPVDERFMIANNEKRITTTFVMESNNNIFFQCIKGLYSDPVVYNGIFDKKTKTTRMALAENAFKDDLSGFLPVQPLISSSEGEYASLISTESIMEWLEEHPEEDVHENVKFVLNHNEDMNPVVVIMK